jgi:rare lipoprotein A
LLRRALPTVVIAAALLVTGIATSEAGSRKSWTDSFASASPATRSFAGNASYYGSESGNRTASGARYNPEGMTAAHRTLPFGTKLRVTEPRSGRSVVVTVNDRGPFIRGRVLDLSVGAARALGLTARGVGHIVAEVM